MAPCTLLASLVVALALAAPADAAGTAAVDGRVLDAQGKPAGGVTVTLMESHRTGIGGVRSVQSASDGIPPFPAAKEGPEYGLVLLAVRRGGGMGSLSIRSLEPRTGLTIPLEDASAEISGRVVDAAGRPITGVTARLTQVRVEDRHTWFPDEVNAPQAVTDSRGRFRLTGLPKNAQVGMRFRHPRYARYENWRLGDTVTAGQTSAEPRPVRLHAAARIEGRVLYPGGKPAAGARVTTFQEAGPDPHYHASANAVTDREGRYRIDQLPPGRYRVSLRDGTHGEEWVARSRRVNRVTAGKPVACGALVLVRGGIATGIVTDKETGAPIEGAQVSASRDGPEGWEGGSTATSDKEGRFRLRLPAGQWNLQVSHPRYVEPWQEGFNPGVPVTVADGQMAAETRHTLRPYATLAVRVLGPDDRPDPRAVILGPEHGRNARFGGRECSPRPAETSSR